MASFVLVHGAWHGGWCWARVARLLRDAGHDVFTPTLTGLGERAHLARPEIDLAHHVQDVLAVLEAEELKSVTLCGHSYGGMVVTGVAARAAARVAHLVYLDAFVPAPGQAMLDLIAPERAAAMREAARTEGEGWRVPPWKPEHYGVTSARDIEWLARRLTPHPLRTLEQPAEAGWERRPALAETAGAAEVASPSHPDSACSGWLSSPCTGVLESARLAGGTIRR